MDDEDSDQEIKNVMANILDRIEYVVVSKKKRISFDEKIYIHYIINRDYFIENNLKKKIWYTGEDMYRFSCQASIIKNIIRKGHIIDEDIFCNLMFPNTIELEVDKLDCDFILE